MFPIKITTFLLVLISVSQMCVSLPIVPSSNVFRLFYEKPSINPIQGKLIQITRPQPVVDTLTEADKCCNTQQHLPGKKLLGVYESISSALATAAQVPSQSKDNIGAAVTGALNNVGAKIVGLQE